MRSILFASLARDRSILYRPLISPDTVAMIDACKVMGATIEIKEDALEIIGNGGEIVFSKHQIDAQNSGQVFRFIAAMAALANQKVAFTGDCSILHRRPIVPLLKAVEKLGAFIKTDPITVQGPVTRYQTEVVGEDSQLVSALLMMGALLEHPLEVQVKNPGEKPWIDLTLSWLDRVGISYENNQYELYRIVGKKGWKGFEYTIPGDWSSASFLIVAALLSQRKLCLKNLCFSDVQGDKQIVPLLIEMGANIDIQPTQIIVYPSKRLMGLEVDVNPMIDAIAILSVLGCFLASPLILKNAKIAQLKESNRLQVMTNELRKMNANIVELDDGLRIYPSKLIGAEVRSHQDHRIAMALTIAAMYAEGNSQLEGEESVKKSYPNFFEELGKLGANFVQLDFNRI